VASTFPPVVFEQLFSECSMLDVVRAPTIFKLDGNAYAARASRVDKVFESWRLSWCSAKNLNCQFLLL
jgi:hypothetical protein